MSSAIQRLRHGWLAALLALAAGVSLLLIMQVDAIKYAPQEPLYNIAFWILIASALGPLIEPLDLVGQILLWNGTGWSIGLAVLGLDSVGSMPLWPVMLAALALTFWPRQSGKQLPPLAAVIALVGGIAVVWFGWGDRFPLLQKWLDER